MPRQNASRHTRHSVGDFLAALPDRRGSELSRVRDVVLKHLPTGYEEVVQNGMVVYQVPLARYADTYNGRPLWYVALAAPKSHLTVHLMAVYGSEKLATQLRQGFRDAGKTLRIGKACIRFQEADELALDVIGDLIRAVSVDQWVDIARRAQTEKGKRRQTKKRTSKVPGLPGLSATRGPGRRTRGCSR